MVIASMSGACGGSFEMSTSAPSSPMFSVAELGGVRGQHKRAGPDRLATPPRSASSPESVPETFAKLRALRADLRPEFRTTLSPGRSLSTVWPQVGARGSDVQEHRHFWPQSAVRQRVASRTSSGPYWRPGAPNSAGSANFRLGPSPAPDPRAPGPTAATRRSTSAWSGPPRRPPTSMPPATATVAP